MRVWRLSVVYIGPKSRTERSRKTKIGTDVAHVTWLGHHFQGQKVKEGGGILWRPPTQLVEDVFAFSVPLQLTHLRCYDHALYKLTFYLLTYWLTLSVGSVSEILSILSYVEKIDEFESPILFSNSCKGAWEIMPANLAYGRLQTFVIPKAHRNAKYLQRIFAIWWQTYKCVGSGLCCRETFRKYLA